MNSLGDIKQNPELLLEAQPDDLIVINNENFKFCQTAGGCYLISSDSKKEFYLNDISGATYESCIRHVRVNGRALLTRRELVEAIKCNTFIVDSFEEQT